MSPTVFQGLRSCAPRSRKRTGGCARCSEACLCVNSCCSMLRSGAFESLCLLCRPIRGSRAKSRVHSEIHGWRTSPRCFQIKWCSKEARLCIIALSKRDCEAACECLRTCGFTARSGTAQERPVFLREFSCNMYGTVASNKSTSPCGAFPSLVTTNKLSEVEVDAQNTPAVPAVDISIIRSNSRCHRSVC